MNLLIKIFLAELILEILINSELDPAASAVLFILFCVLIKLHDFCEIARGGRVRSSAWRSRYNRRRSQ